MYFCGIVSDAGSVEQLVDCHQEIVGGVPFFLFEFAQFFVRGFADVPWEEPRI